MLDSGDPVPPEIEFHQVRKPAKQSVGPDFRYLVIIQEKVGRVHRYVLGDFRQSAAAAVDDGSVAAASGGASTVDNAVSREPRPVLLGTLKNAKHITGKEETKLGFRSAD